MDKGEIYNYLWSLGFEQKNYFFAKIIEAVRGGDRLDILFSDEEWIILRGMITRMDRNIKLNNLLEKK